MKEGYIVANISNCGDEFFGVYRKQEQAEKQLRRVIRKRFGRCPRNLDKLVKPPYLGPNEDDSYQIIYFYEYKGE